MSTGAKNFARKLFSAIEGDGGPSTKGVAGSSGFGWFTTTPKIFEG
jgi:hypothetical protein